MANEIKSDEPGGISVTTIALIAVLLTVISGFAYFFYATSKPAIQTPVVDPTKSSGSTPALSAKDAAIEVVTNQNFDNGIIDLVKTIASSAKGSVNGQLTA